MKLRAQIHENKGFTLIEFIVIMIIFSIMASVSLFNFTGFRNETMVSNLAHDIALTIRQVQVEGSSAVGGPGTRGILFTRDGDGFSNTFSIFQKAIGIPSQYNPNDDIPINEFTISARDQVEIIDSSSNNTITQDVSIVFRRPNPTAYIYDATGTQFDNIIIRVTSRNDPDRFKDIEIHRSGFIHVIE